MHIMIVEDQEPQRAGLERLLKAAGHTTCWSATGEGAIRLMTSEPVDVILLDMNLGSGRMSGWDVARYKIENCPAIPIIIVTGMSTTEVHDRAEINVLEGAILILGKPVHEDLLFRALDAIQETKAPSMPPPIAG